MNKSKIKFSLLQFEGKKNLKNNAILIKKLLSKANNYKPDIICLPECSNIITADKLHLFEHAVTQKHCPVLDVCMNFAKKYKKFVSIGSLLLRKKNSSKLLNRSFFINRSGKILNYYDKIHLFDANINNKEVHCESKYFHKGNKVVCTNSPWGKIGLTICYDIRFPNLYRRLVKQGAKIILVPAAFTIPTGKDHWEILLRSRAIENSSFIIATGQCGKHHAGRTTYGHSMIIDPWGKIIAKSSFRPKIINAIIDINKINQARSKISSINYHKNYFDDE